MKLFAQLYSQLDATTRLSEKQRALEAYFRAAPPDDAAWALSFLLGRRLRRSISSAQLRLWAADEARLPLWMVEECHNTVGDLAETLSLVLPDRPQQSEVQSSEDTPALHRVVSDLLMVLPAMPEPRRRELVVHAWRQFTAPERMLLHKLMGGGFRVGVARGLVVRSLAAVAGVAPEVISQRLAGDWQPSAEAFTALMDPDPAAAPAPISSDGYPPPPRPYPLFLAYPLELPIEQLGNRHDYQAEWKWDGIRAQIVHRARQQVAVWTRGEEEVSARFPELTMLARALPPGTVIDGEIVIWDPGASAPRPFQDLQRRLGRLHASPALQRSHPVQFVTYDILECNEQDIRSIPLIRRRATLEELVNGLPRALPIQLSPTLDAPDWQTLSTLRAEARLRGVEGLMLKRLASAYGSGRITGDWWKWKVNPLSVDAVLVMTQPGHGRRAGLHTDHTFALWHEGQLVPVMKAYSGLTDAEMRELDAWIRKHTIDRFGPVRTIEPFHVMELGFEGVQRSTRHRSGVAVRFPRILRWRRDKRPEEADHLERIDAMLPSTSPHPDAPLEGRPSRPKRTARDIDDDNDLFGFSW